jgi:pimeloyl-ACP methyl ester carboxylesterase
MKWLQRLTDRLVLCPSTHPLDAGTKVRETIQVGNDSIEVWTDSFSSGTDNASKILIIKFPGTGGRAENASVHPAECFSADSVLWTINPFGYGGSEGIATLQRYPEMVNAIGAAATERFPDRKIVVIGNSLGGMSAVLFAAQFDVAAVLLRNPAPVHQLIRYRKRYLVPSIGLSRFVAAQIPFQLDAVENAKRCSAPCLFVSSRRDRVVPPDYQQRIVDAYGGEIELFQLPDAGHETPVPEELQDAYFAAAQRLGIAAALN